MPSETRICQNCKQEFIIEPEDFSFYEKIKVPPPTWCYECRLKRRLSFRNERNLYRRTCDLCGKKMISIYSSDKPFTVYCASCWWSDKWDPMQYGKEYDFSKPFFEQFKELSEKIPKINFFGSDNINSEYANYIWNSKNCYLSYSIIASEDVYYSKAVDKSRLCMDGLHVSNSESSYSLVGADRSYKSRYLNECHDCMESYFLFDCRNCRNCFMSANLRNAQYVFEGQQLSKEIYDEKLVAINMGDQSVVAGLMVSYEKLRIRALHKFADVTKSSDSTGDGIGNVKNVKNAFYVYEAENSKNLFRGHHFKDVYDTNNIVEAEIVYEGNNIGFGGYNLRFVTGVLAGSKNVTYSDSCHSCSDIFGCVGLKKKQYCVLNRQYSEEEYKTLVPKIIAHMNAQPYVGSSGYTCGFGEFFPVELSPFAYNESLSQEYFPMTESEIVNAGLAYKAVEKKGNVDLPLAASLPSHIRTVNDEILNQSIRCAHGGTCTEQCTNLFRIIPRELQLYREWSIPLPELCPNCRHFSRLKISNPLKLWHRTCMCDKPNHTHQGHCPNEFETSYAPDRPEIVYCEQCYNAEVA